MGLQRPAWTLCFAFIALLLVPGALLTHLSVGKLIPAIGDFPTNMVNGFDEVFKFKYLSADSDHLKNNASAVITKCGYMASVQCPKMSSPTMQQLAAINNAGPAGGVSTVAEKNAIDAIFGRSLNTINKVANDKYLGTDEMKDTAQNLNKVKTETKQIKPKMQCGEAVVTFCKIYDNAGLINQGVGKVNSEIEKFKSGDMMTRWEKNKGILTFLHVLPYIMVLALVFYAFFICKGGVCCCCREGTVCGSLANIPFLIFWLISFIIYFVVLATGAVIKFAGNKIEIDELKGKPSLSDTVDHITKEFPEFWDTVFKELVEGLELLFMSSWFFVVVALLIAIYAGCQCCCCPYRKKAEAEASTV